MNKIEKLFELQELATEKPFLPFLLPDFEQVLSKVGDCFIGGLLLDRLTISYLRRKFAKESNVDSIFVSSGLTLLRKLAYQSYRKAGVCVGINFIDEIAYALSLNVNETEMVIDELVNYGLFRVERSYLQTLYQSSLNGLYYSYNNQVHGQILKESIESQEHLRLPAKDIVSINHFSLRNEDKERITHFENDVDGVITYLTEHPQYNPVWDSYDRSKKPILNRKNKEADMGYVYLLPNKSYTEFKIGKTIHPQERMKHFKDVDVDNVILLYCQDPTKVEKTIHTVFDNWNVRDKEYADGYTEWFYIECFPDLLSFIKKYYDNRVIAEESWNKLARRFDVTYKEVRNE